MFGRLIGNDAAKAALRRLIADERVPGSLLFAGEEGVGKKQFALELARAYLCRSPRHREACGECPECLRAVHFTLPRDDDKDAHKRLIFSDHADLGMVLPYRRNILVDAIRDLEKEANFRPYEARLRFFIVDDADRMNDSAANALLKTLEEPPPTSRLVLVTSRPDSLLPTIRSRCQIVRFAPIEEHAIVVHLHSVKGLSEEDARLAATISRGSLGRALALSVERARELRETMLGVVRMAAEARRADLLLMAGRLNEEGRKEDFEPAIEILSAIVRDAWMLRMGSAAIANSDIAARISEAAGDLPPARLARWLASIEELRAAFAVNINRKPATDAMFLGFAAGTK